MSNGAEELEFNVNEYMQITRNDYFLFLIPHILFIFSLCRRYIVAFTKVLTIYHT
jgi:hypothetical protein